MRLDLPQIKLYVCLDRDDAFWKRRIKAVQLKMPSWLTIHVHDYHKEQDHAIPFNAIMWQARQIHPGVKCSLCLYE